MMQLFEKQAVRFGLEVVYKYVDKVDAEGPFRSGKMMGRTYCGCCDHRHRRRSKISGIPGEQEFPVAGSRLRNMRRFL